MSSFLDCEWQHRPDETTVSLATSTSDGPLPSHVGSCSYGTISQHSENDVSPVVAAAAAATTIKSEQEMLLDDDDDDETDDDETADDDNDTTSNRYNNYDDDGDFDFDSSDDEAINARMKMAAKKKKEKQTPHSSNAASTSDRNRHSTLREEIVTNNNNLVPMTKEVVDEYSSTSCLLLDSCKDDRMVASVLRPRNETSMKSTKSIASDGSFHKKIPQGTAKPPSKNPIVWERKRQQLAEFKVKFRHTNVPQIYAENRPLGNWVNNQRLHYRLFKEKKQSQMTRERIQSLEELDFEWVRNTTTWEKSRQQLADFKKKFRHTNVPQRYAENKPLGRWVETQMKQYRLFKEKKKSKMTRERIQSLEELGFKWERRISSWEKSRQQLAEFKKKFRYTNVPQPDAENKPLGTLANNRSMQFYKLFKANNKSSVTRERIQSLKELDFEWQTKARPNFSSFVEKSLSSTEDGYESDDSELYVII